MTKFQSKKEKQKPAVSTASLPDIVFMLLFFFMVVTVMKDADQLVEVRLPDATELKKIKNRTDVQNVYIGKPFKSLASTAGSAPRIQINDKFVEMDEVALILKKGTKEKDLINLRVDKDVTMGMVTDVKTEFRKAERLRVNYMALQREKD